MLQSYKTYSVMTADAKSFSTASPISKIQCSPPLSEPEITPQFHPHHAVMSTTDVSRSSHSAVTDDAPNDGLSDVHLASRKANEAAARRFQAASWLQSMIGPLDLPKKPSEEELRLCLRNGLVLCNLINKIHPGAVSKIVENPNPSSPPPEGVLSYAYQYLDNVRDPCSPPPQGAALYAYQYFENVRNFLVAVEEMKLPSFEASDLEKASLQTGSSAKVVNCILSLKAYYEWQLGGAHGLWKFGCPSKSPCAALKSSPKPIPGSNSNSMAPGRSLEFSTPKNSKTNKCSAVDGHTDFEEFGSIFTPAVRSAQMNGLCKGHHINDTLEDTENSWSTLDSDAAWVQCVSQKRVDAYGVNNKEASLFRMPKTASENMLSESLSNMVAMVLDDKQPEEVPLLVEFMLRKVMEEYERRFSCQEEQLKRYQAKVVEDLPVGLKDCSEQQAKIQALQKELKQVKSMDQHHAFLLELQNNQLRELKCSLETTRLEFQDMQLEWENEMEKLEVKLQGLAQAASEYHKVAAENRELYNQVQDLKGNIRVYCRVRPFLPGENNTQSTVDFIGEKGSIMIVNPAKQGKDQHKVFNFNRVFGPGAAQEEVFLDTQPLIRSVLDGYNVCIFAYGQTGSGKTYTMSGPNNPSPNNWGVNFRALNDLFQISQNRQDVMNYEVGVQMIEIYNEQVRDLLCAEGADKRLEIRSSSKQNGLKVPDANMVPVESTEDVLELMSMGHRNRAVGSTALNERSSRSHSVLTVHVKGTDLASGALLRGCLHLVDLAGSERVDKSEAIGDRLKEAQHINKSLSALGDVIAALAQKSAHVPYRNSKLTQLLQDSLGGQAKALMFVHIGPDDDSYGETISTLKFAERVATVELGAAQTNKESGEVRELKNQIAYLKDALAKKDGEVERFQRESRNKSIECEKARMKGGTSPSPKLRRTAVDVTCQGNRRQPLEEVRNAEVRQSLSSGAQKCHPNADFGSLELHYPNDVYYGCQEEDSFKGRSSNYGFLSNATPTRSSYFSKNKVRLESSEELETVSTIPHARVREARSLSVQNIGGGNETMKPIEGDQAVRENGHMKQIVSKKDYKFADGASLPSVHANQSSYSDKAPKTRRMDSQFKSSFQQASRDVDSQDDSTEDSTGRRGDVDEEMSDYSECDEWQKEKSSISNGKLHLDRRDSPQNGLHTRSERKAGSAAVGRSTRYSVVGSTTFGMESKGAAGKATLETKLVTISSQGGSMECYAKTTFPRQSNVQATTSCNPKSSKRWL